MADEDVKIIIKQKGTIPVYTKTKVGVAEVHHDESLEGKGTVIDPLKVSENIIVDIDSRVEKTSQADKVYGTDAQGNQTTYDVDGFGKVDDVLVNGTSVVTNKIAEVEVPTEVSELTNDADYQSGSQVNNTVSSAINTHNTSNNAHSNLLTPITQDIDAIEEKIPAQASEENKLADKNFVNSSVATNTAYFIGTFNSVEDLEAYSGDVTNNDYAFVISTDSEGNTVYNRYKYNGDTEEWLYEYSLNNSSFTADQWAAINSGATPEAIAQIDTNTDNIADLQTNKQDKLTAGEHITIDANNVISAEGGLPDGEPLSLYGTNEDGEPEAYKVKPQIVLHKKVLPEGYEELDYISNTVAIFSIGENSNTGHHPSISNYTTLRGKFQEADSTLSIKTKDFKFVYMHGGARNGWNIYAIDEEDTEHLFVEDAEASTWKADFGLDFYTTGPSEEGDYFIVNKEGEDGGQYIDTDVNIKADVYGEYDEEASQQVDNVNVTVNTTSSFASGYGTYTYVDFCAFNDGSSNVFAIWPDGESRPSSIGGADYLRDTLGIDVTGDIVWGTSATAKDGTVIRILSVKDYDTFAIKTTAKFAASGDGGIILGSMSKTGNSGVDIDTLTAGAGYPNINVAGQRSFIPVPLFFQDVNLEVVDPTINGQYLVQFNLKLKVGENEIKARNTSYKTVNTITLFANYNEDGIEYSCLPVSLKRTTIWKNDEIVFDAVPCREIATGTVGMYDLVSEEFLSSPSETPFVAGNVIEYPYVSTKVLNLTGDENVDIIHGLDNDEYEQLDWLESDGTCAIDLGITPKLDSQIEVKVKNNSVPTFPDGIRAIYGYYANDVSSRPAFGLRLSGYTPNYFFNLAYCPNSPNTGTTTDICAADTYWHTIKVASSYVIIDGTSIFQHNTVATAGARSIGLFGAFKGMSEPSNWTLEPSYKGRISYLRELTQYSFNSYTSNIIIHDFVAARRKSDGELGFYDKVTGAFCTNQGSGTFVAGEAYGIKVITKPADNVLKTISSNSINKNIINSDANTYGQLIYRNNTVLGCGATSSGDNNVVVGTAAAASSTQGGAVVLGEQATSGGKFSVTLGYMAHTNQDFSTAIGYNSSTNGEYSLAIGHRTITGYPHSIEIGDTQTWQNSSVRCVGQYGIAIGDSHQPYRAKYSIVMGYSNTIGSTTGGNNTRVISLGYYNTTNGDYDINIGSNTEVSSSYTICLGHQTVIKNNSEHSIAIGSNSIANGNYSMAIGNSAKAGTLSNNYTSPLAIGNGAEALANYGVAIGYQAKSLAEDSIQLGHGTNSEAHSFYVGFSNGSVKMLDSTFVIPYERLTTDTPTDGYCLKYDENSDSLVWGEAGGTYELPTATTSRLGGVKVGSGLSVANDGTLSANVQSLNFEDIGGDPHDNQALSDALTGLQSNIDTVQGNLDTVESDLQTQIDNMSSIGEFLAIWDCDTGVARYLNTGFVYPTGGYFIIGAVAAQGQPNYMPDGTTYTGPSTTTTTEDVKVSDMWFYDGTHWIYLANHERQIAVDADLSTTSINPVQNRTITAALDDKQDTLQAGKGITIIDNVISTSGDSVGVPQIANVYSQQLNTSGQASRRMNEESRLGFYSDICFNLNLTKDQIFDKMDELYIGIERFKRNRVTFVNIDPEDPESGEIIYRNIPNFKLQNDKFVHLDQKMFCYRYETGEYGSDDPRHYVVFYTDAEYNSYQDMLNEDPRIWCFYGQWIGGNQASCLNTLRSMGPFDNWEDGEWERYPDGDLEVFVNLKKADSISRNYIKQRKCRSYIIDGVKKYFWSEDWTDLTKEVYTTTDGKIPDSYVNTINYEYKTVSDYAGMEYVQRSDLDYWHYNFDDYDVSEWIQSVLEPATLHGTAWGEDSLDASWQCYWLDYPMRPVLLQDCEVKYEGGWTRLKDISDNDKETLPDNLTFRYPYNTAELWLRFSAWQKRCMYNEFKEETKEYLQLTQKQALAFAWEWDQGHSVTGRRAFGRQRHSYSGSSENTKISEYIQFNLYEPYNVYGGTKSKSTPIQKRITINKQNGSSCIRD